MHEMYIIVVYETSIAIYNASTADFLEEKGKIDKFKYKAGVVNYNGTDIYLFTHNNSQAKNTVQSEVFQLMEIPPQEQIEFLLYQSRIQEAKEVFLTKESKGPNFAIRHKQFNLDAGWVYLMN